MNNILSEVKEKLGKPYHDFEFLLNCLKEVLIENGEGRIAEDIPYITEKDDLPADQLTMKHVQLYSLVFQLVNMAEVNGAVQNRRKVENENHLAEVNGLFAKNIKKLKEAGYDEVELAHWISKISVEPVLTAHPTEAKRATVLDHHRDLYLLLVSMQNTMYSENELMNIKHNIKLSLFRLWKTGEIYVDKPDVPSELRNVLHYLVNVFPEVIPVLDRRLIQAWKACGIEKAKLLDHHGFPKISFGNWVGGDRDGHPLVTHEVTAETLMQLRLNAMVVIKRKLNILVKNLSFSCHREDTIHEMQLRINEMVVEMGDRGMESLLRNKGEAFRQFTNLMISKLPVDTQRGHATQLSNNRGSYVQANELLGDLYLLKSALTQFGAKSIADDDVNNAVRAVETFGFHLAHLDIRQNSAFHDKAIEQLLEAAQFEKTNFSEWTETDRIEFLNKELKSNRPFTHLNTALGPNASAVINSLRVVERHVTTYGSAAIGSYIVSMTRSVSDLLSVYLLAREAGLLVMRNESLACRIPVVPLLETIEDLQHGPEIMDSFLSHQMSKATIDMLFDGREDQAYQQVMVGYSDSNKDGGIIASQWNLYKAQFDLSKIGEQHGLKVMFFHGKGGSISRGSGPTHYFINSLPYNAVDGNIRLTEQGETIAQKYENKVNAEYNLELLVANALQKTIRDKHSSRIYHPLAEVLEKLAAQSKAHYESLTHEDGFIDFFRQATPIDAIEVSKIGSRPSKRTGANSLEDLRAIPWVFSWSQSRYHMTSWYGVGTAFDQLKKENPEDYEQFKKALETDPFIRYFLTNIDTSLAATDEKTMINYANLVQDNQIRDKFLNLFLDELELARKYLQDLLGLGIADRRKNHFFSNSLRAPLMSLLHNKQISLLTKWRKEKEEGNMAAETSQQELMLTINAIASAMRNTG